MILFKHRVTSVKNDYSFYLFSLPQRKKPASGRFFPFLNAFFVIFFNVFHRNMAGVSVNMYRKFYYKLKNYKNYAITNI